MPPVSGPVPSLEESRTGREQRVVSTRRLVHACLHHIQRFGLICHESLLWRCCRRPSEAAPVFISGGVRVRHRMQHSHVGDAHLHVGRGGAQLQGRSSRERERGRAEGQHKDDDGLLRRRETSTERRQKRAMSERRQGLSSLPTRHGGRQAQRREEAHQEGHKGVRQTNLL